MQYIIIIVLLTLSALFSGLTLGLMSLSAHELKRKSELGDEDAKKVYPLRKRGNLLLTTLLVGNVSVNAALSIFLGSITSGVLAGIIATMLIVVFGEIIPQAVFSRFALKLGAKATPLVSFTMYLLYPVTLPIAWLLNKTLGDELPTIYSKQELVKIVEEHEDAKESDLDQDEERIIKGALTFSDKKVRDIMTPHTVVTAFDAEEEVDNSLFNKVKESGLSRFPVFEKEWNRVVGILFSSDLIGITPKSKKVKDLMRRRIHELSESESLDNALDTFLNTRKHLAIVRDEFGGFSGVITLEDILEEIIRTEIVDERDKYADMRKFAKVKAEKRLND